MNATASRAPAQAISIGLVENDPYAMRMIRAHIEHLDSSFHVIWASATGVAALHHCFVGKAPQVLVLDMSLTDMDGLHVCRTLRKQTAAIGIVGITALDPKDFMEDLVSAGAQALVAKNDIPTQLRPAILAAAAAEPYDPNSKSPRFMTVLHAHRMLATMAESEQLSERERTIMRLYAQGLTTKRISRSLGISPATVYVHVHQVMKKTGTSSRQEALLACASQHFL